MRRNNPNSGSLPAIMKRRGIPAHSAYTIPKIFYFELESKSSKNKKQMANFHKNYAITPKLTFFAGFLHWQPLSPMVKYCNHADVVDFGAVTSGKVFWYALRGKQMDKKHRLICGLCAVCGIIGVILMIVAGFMENAFPRPLWFVASICMFLNVIGIILNYRHIRKNEKADPSEEKK